VLSMAANALRSFLASRAAGNQAGSSSAAGAGSAGHQGGDGRRWVSDRAPVGMHQCLAHSWEWQGSRQ
jgi:hypothetical protein